jgi:hypothetical protein
MIDTRPPDDAIGEYAGYRGKTWIKDLAPEPRWRWAYVWSHTMRRWRKKRTPVDMQRVTLFEEKWK